MWNSLMSKMEDVREAVEVFGKQMYAILPHVHVPD